MFQLRVRGRCHADAHVLQRLDSRARHSPAEFAAVCKRYSNSYGRFGWIPNASGNPPARSYCIAQVSSLGRRRYEYTPLEELHLLAVPKNFKRLWPRSPQSGAGSEPSPGVAEHDAASAASLLKLLGNLQAAAVTAPKAVASAGAAVAPADASHGLDAGSAVREVAAAVLPGVSADAPLMESGLDSLGAVELRSHDAASAASPQTPMVLAFFSLAEKQLQWERGLRHVSQHALGPLPVPLANSRVEPTSCDQDVRCPGLALIGLSDADALAFLVRSRRTQPQPAVPRQDGSLPREGRRCNRR